MTAAARALGVVHNPAPRLNLPVKDDAKFVSDRIRARLYGLFAGGGEILR